MSTEWTEDELRELADPDTWEPGELVMPEASANRGSDLVVPFDRLEFRRLNVAARACGCSLVDFVRRAALDRAASAAPMSPH